VGHLAEVAMPGGELAVQEPWRMALAYLLEAGFEPNSNRFGVSSSSVRTLQQLMARGFHFPMTSSVGRLFDGAAALLGVRAKASFEGQAAMELEALAMRENSGSHPAYDMPLSDNGETEPFRVEILPMIRGMEADIRRGVPGSEIAGRFHESLIQMIVRVCEKLRRASGLDKVVLSGGVFMNGILLSGAVRSLKNHEFQVFFHRQVPPNDGGLCLGQLAVGAARLRREKENVSGGSWEAGGNLPRA
jgi:hydrogenase maturation protein HypF